MASKEGTDAQEKAKRTPAEEQISRGRQGIPWGVMEHPMTKVDKRLNVAITNELDELIDELARDAGTSRADIVRRALAVMKAYKSQKKAGRNHIGFTDAPEKLDAELLNVL